MSTCTSCYDWSFKKEENKKYLKAELQKVLQAIDRQDEHIIFYVGPLEINIDTINDELYIIE